MSISIFYTVVRSHGLTDAEQSAIAAVKSKYSVHDQIEKYLQTGEGLNWEDFIFYDPPLLPGAILEGSTNLPNNSEEAIWIGLQHWCKALTELRRLIPDAAWRVHVDDHKIPWDDAEQEYDPTK